MPMINCPECGKEISDLAEKCPNCGFPIGFESKRTYTAPSGTPYQNSNPYQPHNIYQQSNTYEIKQKNSGLGIAALVLSILGCTFWLGIILAVIDLCKKGNNKKTCSIAALCICGFWVIVGIIGTAGKDSTSESIPDRTTVESTSADTKENVVETAEKASEPTVEDDAGEPETKDKYFVGDTWQNKYVLVSFDDCGIYESDNQFIQPASGNKYIYATFTFENVGNSDTTVAYWDFDCYADGYACEGTYGADDAAFSQTLSSGRKITGSVYFEVPESASEIEFEYSPSFWTSEKIVFVYQ